MTHQEARSQMLPNKSNFRRYRTETRGHWVEVCKLVIDVPISSKFAFCPLCENESEALSVEGAGETLLQLRWLPQCPIPADLGLLHHLLGGFSSTTLLLQRTAARSFPEHLPHTPTLKGSFIEWLWCLVRHLGMSSYPSTLEHLTANFFYKEQ